MIRTIILLAALAPAAAASAGGDTLSLQRGGLRVLLVPDRGAYREEWFAARAGRWFRVAEGGSERRAPLVIGTSRGMVPVSLTRAERIGRGDSASLELSGALGEIEFRKTIGIPASSQFAHVTVSMHTASGLSLGALLATYAFAPAGESPVHPDFVFTPQLRPAADEVIADHIFRSPAFVIQRGSVAMGIVPDLLTIDGKERPVKAGGDLQVEGLPRPFVSIGLLNWARTKEHVYYVHADSMLSRIGPGTLSFAFYLYASARAPARAAYRELVRFHWNTYGHDNLLRPLSPQSEPFSSYIRKAWDEFVPSVALDTVYRGVPVTLLRQARLAWSNHLPAAADNDCWFNVWFNALRTAYGMYLGGEPGSLLRRRAERVLNLALLAPRDGGLAPTIFYIDSLGGHWVADHDWGGIDGGKRLPMFHNAWTATWLLSWAGLLPERKEEILRYTSGIARFLIARQESSGVIPSWYDAATGEPSPVLRDENAESAGAALFLSRYAAVTGDVPARLAAERAMEYIFRQVVPARKWYDFETFFSCARKPVGFRDTVTGEYPQNTLSMDMAAEASASLYRLTGRRAYLEEGSAILDYLCLYQQVWSPRWLSRELFGGFGVQNTDAEWSDARQGYFALTLFEYYDLTGRREYFERGVAALRAMFSLFESPGSPRTAENYGHSGGDDPAGVTGLHWGTGSSVVSVEIVTRKYGGAFVNVRGGWGAGIDGCSIPSVRVAGGVIRLTLLDNLGIHRTVRVKFSGVGSRSYTLVANGRSVGKFTARALEQGIDVAL